VTSDRWDELLNGWLDGRLSPAELAELARILDADAERRKEFARAVDQHRALGALLARPARASRRRIWIAAAAAVALLAIGLVAAPPRPRPAAPPVVKTPPPPLPELPKPAPEPERPKEPDPAAPVPPPPLPPPKPEPRPEPPATKEPVPFVEPPPPPPPAPPRETRTAVARLESVKGEAHTVSDRGQKPARAGQTLFDGEGLETGAGAAVLSFADGTRIELGPAAVLNEIGPRVGLARGALTADLAKPRVFVTPHAEAAALGARLSLSVGERTKLEVKEGKVRFTRLDDKRSVEVGPGQGAVAAKGLALAVKRVTRGPMMAGAALWGEDFRDPEEVERDWRVKREGTGAAFDGLLRFDLRPGSASLMTERGFDAPFRVTVDVEFTHRLRGTLLGLRLGSWKEGGGIVHCDLDESFYHLTVGARTFTAPATRPGPRRERWSVELRADGTAVFSVDGRELLKGGDGAPAREYHVTLLAKVGAEVPAGARAGFDTLLVERLK
jgi:hypothetical protein